MKEATLYQKGAKNLLKCTACRHGCLIADGFSGKCGVRINTGGKLFLRVYSHAIAVNNDPIEKKPLFHFLPGTKIFSFGTIGCNFQCTFCQNWNISQMINTARESRKNNSRSGTELFIGDLCEEGQDLSPQEIVDYCVENKIPSIAYTYNEPTIFVEYAHDTAMLAKKKGIKNVFVSNGYESVECLEYMKSWCDAINIDIKSFSKDFYKSLCGGVKLDGVLDTVMRAHEMGFWIECTTLVIPDLNDGKKELTGIAEFIAGVSKDIPWHVTGFHPDYKMTDHHSTRTETLQKAYEIGKKAGLKFVYSGNLFMEGGENTYCPKCDTLLIERTGMSCVGNKIDAKGKCPKCGEKIPGIWK